jgi:hypothetical protein
MILVAIVPLAFMPDMPRMFGECGKLCDVPVADAPDMNSAQSKRLVSRFINSEPQIAVAMVDVGDALFADVPQKLDTAVP